MLLAQNPRNLSLIRGSYYGKGGLTGGMGDTATLTFPAATSNINPSSIDSANPVNWNPNTSSWVTEVNSILLPAEGQTFNESLAPYTTPLGVTGGDIITWVKNNWLTAFGLGVLALIVIPHFGKR